MCMLDEGEAGRMDAMNLRLDANIRGRRRPGVSARRDSGCALATTANKSRQSILPFVLQAVFTIHHKLPTGERLECQPEPRPIRDLRFDIDLV